MAFSLRVFCLFFSLVLISSSLGQGDAEYKLCEVDRLLEKYNMTTTDDVPEIQVYRPGETYECKCAPGYYTLDGDCFVRYVVSLESFKNL